MTNCSTHRFVWGVISMVIPQGMSFAYFPSVSDEEAISVIHR